MPGVDVVELMQVHRRHVVEAMQSYTHLKADTPLGEVSLGLVIDAELFRLEAIVALAGRGRSAACATCRTRPGPRPRVPTRRRPPSNPEDRNDGSSQRRA